ncbi:MAG: hypothetical protein JW395_0734 [Nitrospira sp.]|nr:hypothetical protein [Nitrospira sp.]
MEGILEVMDEGSVLAWCPPQRTAGPLDGFLCAPPSRYHYEGVDVRKVKPLIGQRGGDHDFDVPCLELFHRFAAKLLRHLRVNEYGAAQGQVVIFSECDSWNQNECGILRTTGCGHHDCHVVSGFVTTYTDLGKCFPSAHSPKDRLTDLHVAFAIGEQPLDLIIDPLLEMEVSGGTHVHGGMSQYTGQFITADLELGIAEHLTKDLITLGIIGPRSRVKAEAESFAGLDDLTPGGRRRMLGFVNDDQVLAGEIYGVMGATNFDP